MNGVEGKTPFLIGVAGGTASGKSTVCQKIMERLGEIDRANKERQVVTISQASFYRELTPSEREKASRGLFNFDHPTAFNEKLMLSTLKEIQAGHKVDIPVYDYVNNARSENQVATIYPADVVLVEGILVFYFPEIRDIFHMKLFVDSDSDSRLARIVPRDIKHRGRDLEQVLNHYMTFVKPAFEEFCMPTKKFADIIIPRGADNSVGIDLITAHIESLLHGDPKTPPNERRFSFNSDCLIAIELIVHHIRDFLKNRGSTPPPPLTSPTTSPVHSGRRYTNDAAIKMANEANSIEESLQLENLNAGCLPWDNFASWVRCICIVTFDLEIGQAIEVIYPNSAVLTEQEKTGICYLAFPDSNSGCMGDTQFHFRMRSLSKPTVVGETPYYYGFVYFRQVKDKDLPRGYFQKSVVIVSYLPLISFFMSVLGVIAPEFFDHGEPSLDAACREIDKWPQPIADKLLTVSVFGNELQVELPSPPAQLLTAVCDVDVFQCFASLLPHVQLLWELVLIGEPLVVMASQPQTSSDLVQALVSMIAPLRYCADYRPYFTIHDAEFKEYTNRSQSPPAVILGVTNPFFAKTLQHWPHIIKTCDGGFSGQKLRRAGNLRMLDSRPGVYTQYRSFLYKDKAIQSKLLKGVQTKRPANVQTVLLKRHLLELTHSFMIPLERYMSSCMPLQKNISPFREAPTPRPFNPTDFLTTLDAAGPQLTSGIKGDWAGLYRRFFRSPNFLGWYNARYQEVSDTLIALHLQSLSQADMTEWVEGRAEVEVVDMVLRLRSKLLQYNSVLSQATADSLRCRLDDLISTLPEDMRSILESS